MSQVNYVSLFDVIAGSPASPRRAWLVEAGLMDMFKVYVLLSEDRQKSYVGSTNDLDRRIGEHNSGKHSYTRRYKPWRIIYTESFDSEFDARERERYLKTTAGRRFLKKIFERP